MRRGPLGIRKSSAALRQQALVWGARRLSPNRPPAPVPFPRRAMAQEIGEDVSEPMSDYLQSMKDNDFDEEKCLPEYKEVETAMASAVSAGDGLSPAPRRRSIPQRCSQRGLAPPLSCLPAQPAGFWQKNDCQHQLPPAAVAPGLQAWEEVHPLGLIKRRAGAGLVSCSSSRPLFPRSGYVGPVRAGRGPWPGGPGHEKEVHGPAAGPEMIIRSGISIQLQLQLSFRF